MKLGLPIDEAFPGPSENCNRFNGRKQVSKIVEAAASCLGAQVLSEMFRQPSGLPLVFSCWFNP